MLISGIKKYKQLVFLLLFYTCVNAFGQKASDDFTGKWKVEEGKIIEISKLNGTYNGIGIPEKVHVLKDVKFKDGKWEGMIYNPMNKKEAKCEVELSGPDQLKITAKFGSYRKTFFWKKSK